MGGTETGALVATVSGRACETPSAGPLGFGALLTGSAVRTAGPAGATREAATPPGPAGEPGAALPIEGACPAGVAGPGVGESLVQG